MGEDWLLPLIAAAVMVAVLANLSCNALVSRSISFDVTELAFPVNGSYDELVMNPILYPMQQDAIAHIPLVDDYRRGCYKSQWHLTVFELAARDRRSLKSLGAFAEKET